MSELSVGNIGRAQAGEIRPVAPARPVNPGRTILVRPVGSSKPITPDSAPIRRRQLADTRQAPARGTAHQSNADGDSATFSSKLDQITGDERSELTRLKKRDSEVRTHEQAHLSSAGGLSAGGPNYETKTGPDGERYAVGGSVQIDTSPGATPSETIAKAQRMKQAALAPANPSGQDRAVAAKAMRMESEARRDISKTGKDPSNSSNSNNSTFDAASSQKNQSGISSLDIIA
jgi:SprA-related family